MNRHTPGPWTTGGVVTRVEHWPKGWSDPICVADCHAKQAPESKSERVANARLIAAAPELLQSLDDLQEMAVSAIGNRDNGSDFDRAMESLDRVAKEARIAIAKATTP